jgi:cold shock CspA family protein
MKKVLLVVLALLISVAFVTTVFAQSEKAISSGAAATGQPQKPMAPGPKDTGAPSVTKAGPAASAGAAKALVFKGEVVSVDAAAKTLVVKDKKGEKTFDYSNVKKMAELKAGDKVSLQYAEKDGKLWAANVQKAGAKAPAKTEATAISTGAQAAGEAKPAPAKPAPAPAPAK